LLSPFSYQFLISQGKIKNRFNTFMNLRIVTLTILATTAIISPVKAQSVPAQSSDNQVLNACVQNRAETLPVPFSDVPPDHWAFKAVMTMHYCGAFRQATPPALFERLKPTPSQKSQPQSESQPQVKPNLSSS
jgi:hypothetical protein